MAVAVARATEAGFPSSSRERRGTSCRISMMAAGQYVQTSLSYYCIDVLEASETQNCYSVVVTAAAIHFLF